ncbi:MAG TPA: AbrB/MazE/SpoVT family DNA-binding domain-containing protein [bacterium]|jgi:hypothetical protein|nr:AbrB/MazE/SpoVT family DNA-binding domain-containing protein [bacterium]HNZ52600.1 AbrB/MazE/SpoVT family DNA-binding domain-containing protein [bacterium]HOG42503.1 AbrB/MazE/SpoVT family DNA-binding domain-containing protein [bacterium]HPY14731.1 AbrB/MazE/SpoVT family DNA-binding domain-containing protein [bacterium]HQB08901.1 AbrB/MazE/SpoVT family DNA-binding domain-containing protein [bacterium]
MEKINLPNDASFSSNGVVVTSSNQTSTSFKRKVLKSVSQNVSIKKIFNINSQNLDFSDYSPMFASEKSLSKDWLLPEEDEAWKDL